MKKLLSLLLTICLAGCAGTTFYDRSSGRKIADFRGNYVGLNWHDGQTGWTAAQVDHSTATLAGGQATAQIVNAISAGVAAGILAASGGGVIPSVVTKLGAAAIPLTVHMVNGKPVVQTMTLHR